MKINVLAVTKFIISGTVGIGTGKIVGRIIKAHVKPENIIDQVAMVAATWAIGAIATETTKKYTDDTIDHVVEAVKTTKKAIKLRRALTRVNTGKSTLKDEGLSPELLERNKEGKWEVVAGIDPYIQADAEEVSS